jgi:hypothetical protein
MYVGMDCIDRGKGLMFHDCLRTFEPVGADQVVVLENRDTAAMAP